MGEKEPKAELRRSNTELGTPNSAHCTQPGEGGNPKKLQLKLARQKRLRLSISHLPSSSFQTARVVEWQTRTFEGRMPKGMRVQVPPRAPPFYSLTRGNTSTYLPHKWTFLPLFSLFFDSAAPAGFGVFAGKLLANFLETIEEVS
jgi:hypothetical protein